MKHPFDDTEENRNPALCIPRSFSLRRDLCAALRARAAQLGLSMSGYLSILVRHDLARGMDAPLSLEPSGTRQSPPRGVVVEFDLEEEDESNY
jgi:hypothetical protein